MRCPEGKIKAGILHTNPHVRRRAVRYFGGSPDPTIMPLVIQAVEKYRREDAAYSLIGLAPNLTQTEETISWVLRELATDDRDTEDDEAETNYLFHLSRVLNEADPKLLLPRAEGICGSRAFTPAMRQLWNQRLETFAWDEAECWRRLEQFCEQHRNKTYTSEFDIDDGYVLVRSLAQHGRACEDKVRELLTIQVEDFRGHPMRWLEPFAIHLAGRARLTSTVPMLVAKLAADEDADLTCSECQEALIRIGGDEVVRAVSSAWPAAPWHFRLYAATVLERVHSDLAVTACLERFAGEPDGEIRQSLVHSLLGQCATEGVGLAREWLLGMKDELDELDGEPLALRRALLETSLLMDEPFPEREDWLEEDRIQEEERQREIAEFGDDPDALLRYSIAKMADAIGRKDEREPEPVSEALAPTPPLAATFQVGRNDRCPCGSGKKFKQCCLRK